MARYIGGRVLWMIPTLLVMSIILFSLIHLAPGNPFQQEKGDPNFVANQERIYGLDKPLPVQYVNWIGSALHGEFGYSLAQKTRKVQEILVEQFPVSFRIGILATILAFIGGIALGVLSAVNQNGPLDYIGTVIATLGASIPNFVAAFLLLFLSINVFKNSLGIDLGFHTSWSGAPRDYVLPVLSLAFLPLATITSFTRSSMLDAIRSDYVRTARAKGMAESRVIVRHVLKNALMPAIILIGPIFAGVGTGTFVVENTFAIPGIGQLFVTSVLNRDYPMFLGVFLLFGVFLTVMALAVDIAYSLVDPRVRLTGRR